jgi:hypothetical protein
MWLVGGGDLLLIGAADGDVASRLAAVGNSARSGAVDAVLRDVGAAPGTAPFALGFMVVPRLTMPRRFATSLQRSRRRFVMRSIAQRLRIGHRAARWT